MTAGWDLLPTRSSCQSPVTGRERKGNFRLRGISLEIREAQEAQRMAGSSLKLGRRYFCSLGRRRDLCTGGREECTTSWDSLNGLTSSRCLP